MDINLARALQLYSQGRYAEAREWCAKGAAQARAAERANPGQGKPSSLLWFVDGQAALGLGDSQGAVASLLRAVNLAPHDGKVLHFCGKALLQNSQPEEAVAVLKQAVLRSHNTAELLLDLGNALRQSGQSGAALEPLRQASRMAPTTAEVWHILGLALLDQAQWSEAEAALSQAVELASDGEQIIARLHWVQALRQIEQWERAYEQAHLAYQIAPNNAEVLNELGLVLRGLSRPDHAEAAFAEAIRLDPTIAQYVANRALALQECGRYAEAEILCQYVLTSDPNNVTAITCQAELLLSAGDYTNGLAAWEMHWAVEDGSSRYRQPIAPQWDGSPAPGATLLVRNDQGFGDTLMMARLFTPAARRLGQGSRLIVECQEPLVSLMESVAAVHSVVRRGRDWPAHDLQINLMSLPYALGLISETVPHAPYLPEPSVSKAWSVPAGEGPAIGLCWAGRSAFQDRSVPLAELWTALQQGCAGRSVRWVCLQADEQRAAASRIPGLEVPPAPRSFADTAAVMSQLDAVISVDTAVLHLAGALGVPLAALLAKGSSWRYGRPGARSPWYPSAALFRQSSLHDWTHPLSSLSQWVGQLLDGWFIERRRRWW